MFTTSCRLPHCTPPSDHLIFTRAHEWSHLEFGAQFSVLHRSFGYCFIQKLFFQYMHLAIGWREQRGTLGRIANKLEYERIRIENKPTEKSNEAGERKANCMWIYVLLLILQCVCRRQNVPTFLISAEHTHARACAGNEREMLAHGSPWHHVVYFIGCKLQTYAANSQHGTHIGTGQSEEFIEIQHDVRWADVPACLPACNDIKKGLEWPSVSAGSVAHSLTTTRQK